jgi:acyl-CoA hydrolase
MTKVRNETNDIDSERKMEFIFEQILKTVGPHIKMAIPLAIGKPNFFVNYVYRRVKANSSLRLTISTALTFERPKGKSFFEEKFLGPMVDRVFGDYPDLDYETDRTADALPSNIEVIEFYFPAGKFLNNVPTQRHYISCNYTHVARDMVNRGVNVVAQMICKRPGENETLFSLSSNPDVTADLVPMLKATGRPLITVGQINQNLPFMYGDALVNENFFDFIIDNPNQYFKIFSPPKTSVSDLDFIIGLYASTLVKDDGQLQVGIGSLGDAIIHSLLLKNQNNPMYLQIVDDFKIRQKFAAVLEDSGYLGTFEKGLFGATEMLVDGFMELYKAKILKKKVYDHIGLQRLINKGLLTENFNPSTIIDVLIQNHIIHVKLTEEDVKFLIYWGIFKKEVSFNSGILSLKNQNLTVDADLNLKANTEIIVKDFLGTKLQHGHVAHGGFFVGHQKYYQWLHELSEDERKLFAMRSVQKINQLYGHEELDRLHLKNARFINTCMMTTLLGAHVSDGLSDGRVVSGVGGQFNFVSMAQELGDARSILTMRSTRHTKGGLRSSIVYNYGHTTVPRHMRDILITEYGIADLRSKTDEEIIIELLKVCDSRFQEELMEQAKTMGKLRADYELPPEFTENNPEKIHSQIAVYKKQGMFNPFPFGTDLTREEMVLGKALKGLKAKMTHGVSEMLPLIFKSIMLKPRPEDEQFLKRMELEHPKDFREKLYQKLLLSQLQHKT